MESNSNVLSHPLHGIIPPMITPLLDRDTLDVDGLERPGDRTLRGLERRDELPRAGRITFRRLTADLADRIEVIIRFLAVLELYKQGAVEIDQPERFGDIEVAWTAGDDFDSEAILIDSYEG